MGQQHLEFYGGVNEDDEDEIMRQILQESLKTAEEEEKKRGKEENKEIKEEKKEEEYLIECMQKVEIKEEEEGKPKMEVEGSKAEAK